jgi:ZIP family zinc transporter
MELILWGGLTSLAAGLMTGLGALPVLAGRGLSRRANDGLLGFAAGVMLSASYFSLLIPGIEAAEALRGTRAAAAVIAAAGLVLGVAAVAGLNAVLPHEHFVRGREGADAGEIARIWLFVLAITIHNFPEGMAVGIGFAGGDIAKGATLALGIGVQNAPEGMAVAVALRAAGYGARRSVAVAALTGLIEPVGGLLGVTLVSSSALVLPWGLAFAAGAMLYVISHEIIPEIHRHGHAAEATAGLTLGLVVMMVLDVALG